MKAPQISIVVRTLNEERHLPALFDSLDSQSQRDYELLVVDSGSVDRTREIANERAHRVLSVSPQDFTFGHSLNTGIRAARGRFIAIISAHAIPDGTEWLASLVAPLKEQRTAMVYGRQVGGESSRFGETRDYERDFGASPRVMRPKRFFANNANSAIRRDLWDQHPFDETLPGLEDIEWAMHWTSAGYEVRYEPQAAVRHLHDESRAQVRRRYFREGEAAAWLGVKSRRNLPGELIRAARNTMSDAGAALVSGRRVGETLRFRWDHMAGTVAGVWQGRRSGPVTDNRRLFYDSQYRALVVNGPRRVGFEDRRIPELKPGEALVRVAYVGLCATDLEIIEGRLGYYKTGLAHYPIVPGHELSGTVAAVGSRVAEVTEGDRVVVECIQGCGVCRECRRDNAIGCAERAEVGVIRRDGGYAEYMVCPARFLHRIPSGLSLREAALCEPAAVVLKGLRRLAGAWGPGDHPRSCGVIGAGPIGHLTARLLEARGHEVVVFDRRQDRRELFQGSRITATNDLETALAADAIVEATGDPDALEQIIHGSRANVAILLLGLPYAHREFSFETIVGYDKTVVGSVGSTAKEFALAPSVLRDIDTSAFLRSSFPLSAYKEALELAESRRFLKVMLQLDERLGAEDIG
jgi:threonine dehydrogenase-like Zn-dependent dehydrogenase/GT2 family glycosyltransferase